MGKIEQRLTRLERQTGGSKGLRIFRQSLDNPDLYSDEGGALHTRAQIGDIQAQGWQCVVVVYG